jgi:hypothetical protein
MKLTSPMRSATSFTPTLWPAKTWLTLALSFQRQIRPHDDQAFDLEGQLIGLAIVSPRPVSVALEPGLLVAAEDLVAGLARDAELPAEGRHGLTVEAAGDETKTLVFHVTLLPRHRCVLRKGPKV